MYYLYIYQKWTPTVPLRLTDQQGSVLHKLGISMLLMIPQRHICFSTVALFSKKKNGYNHIILYYIIFFKSSPRREKPRATVKALLVFPAAPSCAMDRTEATPCGEKTMFSSTESWLNWWKTFSPKSDCLSCRELSSPLLRVSSRKMQSILGKTGEHLNFAPLP